MQGCPGREPAPFIRMARVYCATRRRPAADMVSRTPAVAVLFVALVALAYCETDPATPEAADRVRRAEQRCTPGTTYKKDCNTCSCNKDGTAAVCTLKGCLHRSARAASCTPGTTYKDRCNVCRCGPDGTSGACTRKACPPGTY